MHTTSTGSAACQRNHWSHPAHIAQKPHTCADHASHFRRLTPAAAMRPAAADAGAAAGCFRCVSSGTLGNGSCRRRDLSAFCKSSCRVSTAAATCACTPLGLATYNVVVSAMSRPGNVALVACTQCHWHIANRIALMSMALAQIMHCLRQTDADSFKLEQIHQSRQHTATCGSVANVGMRGLKYECTALKDPRGTTRSCQALTHSSTL
jgi:hypothetical protein